MTIPTSNRFSSAGRPVPSFFIEVREHARKRWDQLKSDPELAGPWWQLFSQVQSPRHVLSELLQNADDVGAKHARASIVDGRFMFEHDGEDFNEDHFSSLCRFGFSNKRKLHTIGFRGIGFKSTFSLGDTVEVLTPSLAVSFNRRRFTEPMWIDDAPSSGFTRIEVKIQDQNREIEIKKNLEDWVSSPASLLFFNSISELTIGDVTLGKDVLGPGPIMGSERVRLTGCGEHNLLVIRSPEELFPEKAVEEIRQERFAEDLNLPPCRVELVVGLPGVQRLYVVLPTGVEVQLPFSCNAPFLQDPTRTAIKNPSLSSTNRWLLSRLGKLAGNTLCRWLQNTSLPLDVRIDAYCLFPEKAEGGDSIEADCTMAIYRGFAGATNAAPLLLTTAGFLVEKEECIAPPQEAYAVWSINELLKIFANDKKHVLCEKITQQTRQRLESLDRLNGLVPNAILDRLAISLSVPRPQTSERLLKLWCFVQQSVRYDFDGQKRRLLSLVPVEGQDRLFPANEIVRLPSKKESISDEAWDFLSGLVLVIDRRWVEYLRQTAGENTDVEMGRQLLRDLQLERPSDVNEVIGKACRRLFAQADVGLQESVLMAHVMAALDARPVDEFRCVTRDNGQRRLGDGIIAAQDANLEELFQTQWCESHFLHDDYCRDFTACSKQQWQTWIISSKSGFMPFALLKEKVTNYWGQSQVENLLDSRQAERPQSYPYQRWDFRFYDYDFNNPLLEHWKQMEEVDHGVWAVVAQRIISAPQWYWKQNTHAKLKQCGRIYMETVACGPIPSAWVMRFSSIRCLPDTQGIVRTPAELYLRTPATEPLIGVEPFVRAELDTEATKPLLRLLGVRDTPAGLSNLLGRIRALSGASDPLPLLHEIIKWYGALDRVLARCDPSGLEEARETFRRERLILTSSGEWTTSTGVFQRASEDDLPDAPVIHSSIQDLTMWARLGVADRPSTELVLEWLSSLHSGEVVDTASGRRVRAALQRYPVQVWENCRHWLSLDNTWTPVEQFRLRLTMRGLTKWGDLFPTVKSRTANLTMVSAVVCEYQPFSLIPDLGVSVDYRLTEIPQELPPPVSKPWLVTLSSSLRRLKLADEEQTERVHAVAVRLGHSVWQSFKTIGVTPYIDGTPAGAPHSPDVLWHEETVFVREGRLAKSFDALVKELARPFATESVTNAINACIERNEDFITEYMEEHFDLEDEIEPATVPVPPREVESEQNMEENGVGAGPETALVKEEGAVEKPKPLGLLGEDDPTETEEAHSHQDDKGPKPLPKPPQVPLFNRYAAAIGFRWDDIRQSFVHPDGTLIKKCESPFQWRRFDMEGRELTSYWSSQQCLTRGGVEIAAELWELISSNPGECLLILVDEADRPRELAGKDLLRMVDDKVIQVYPAKYRIREDSP